MFFKNDGGVLHILDECHQELRYSYMFLEIYVLCLIICVSMEGEFVFSKC